MEALVAHRKRVRRIIVRLASWSELCHIKDHAILPVKESWIKRSELLTFILPGFFFKSLKFISWLVPVIRIKRLVLLLIVMGTAVDVTSTILLGRAKIFLEGHVRMHFSYIFVPHFFLPHQSGVCPFSWQKLQNRAVFVSALDGNKWSESSFVSISSLFL